jgi:hypothetical protein
MRSPAYRGRGYGRVRGFADPRLSRRTRRNVAMTPWRSQSIMGGPSGRPSRGAQSDRFQFLQTLHIEWCSPSSRIVTG